MHREGFTPRGYPVWTDNEVEVLTKHAPDYATIYRLIPARSEKAIQKKASALGLAAKKYSNWSAVDRSKLRKIYPAATLDELKQTFPTRTHAAIKQVASRIKVRRRRKPYALTGNEVIDQIRARCFEIGWTMIDLDNAARTRKYFRKKKWRFGWINYNILRRAVLALDGDLKVEWKD